MTAETILGAIAVYLLLAMVWTLLYAVVSLLDPNAFQLPPVDAARIDRARLGTDLPTFVYYSFVTLTTMGYGDITPVAGWRLTGPMTAMNGILMFGWSTAVLFEVLRKTVEHLAAIAAPKSSSGDRG